MDLLSTVKETIWNSTDPVEAVMDIPGLKDAYLDDSDTVIVWASAQDRENAEFGMDAEEFRKYVEERTLSSSAGAMSTALDAGFGDLFGSDSVFVCRLEDVDHALREMIVLKKDECISSASIEVTVSAGDKAKNGPEVMVSISRHCGTDGFVGDWCIFDGSEPWWQTVESGIGTGHLPDDLTDDERNTLKAFVEGAIDQWVNMLPESLRYE
jgi:hypothetical protein